MRIGSSRQYKPQFGLGSGRSSNRYRAYKSGLMPDRRAFLLGAAGIVAVGATGTAATLIGRQIINNSPTGATRPVSVGNEIVEACTSTPKTVHVIFFDNSDLDDNTGLQQSTIESLTAPDRFLSQTDPGDHVYVIELTDRVSDPASLIWRGCDPGRPEAANILFTTPQILAKAREAELISPYKKAIRDAQQPMERPRTPLVEGLKALTRYLDMQVPLETRRRLLIVSDMLQHTDAATVYGSRKRSRFFFNRRAQDYLRAYATELPGAEINIGLIERFRHRDRQARLQPWFDRYFMDAGAKRPQWFRI